MLFLGDHKENTGLKRPLPENFREEDLSLFANDLLIPKTKQGTKIMHHIRVNGDGLLMEPGRILVDSFVDQNPSLKDMLKASLSLGKDLIGATCKELEGRYIWFTDNWSHMYFHWFMDALPRLLSVKEELSHTTLLLPHRLAKLGFVKQTLDLFDINRIKVIQNREVFRVEELVLPVQTAPTGSYSKASISELRDFFRQSYDPSLPSFKRIYISRSRAAKRNVINEEEVQAFMQNLGFEVIHFETMNIAEKLSACFHCESMVSIHGAGLTHMLFMPPNSTILELRRQDDSHNNAFFSLTHTLDNRYFYQLCKGDSADTHHANLWVDMKVLEKNVRLMLRSNI